MNHTPNPDDTVPTSDIDEAAAPPIEVELEAVKAELASLKEDALRERADLENQRKRLSREIETARRFANERLLGELLPVIDSLEAGLGNADGDASPLREGMELTLRQLLKVGADNGLVPVDPVGQPFNPDHHQAMSMVDSPDHAPNHVVQVYQKGWLLNDRLLRPALVVVCQGT
ncbi:nucleotide exchange factor GrpE [Lysobacter sp. SG-8]|uniref:Protein GrpE n=1 Tax=Marilutibacter penaei TaxID=2759900 RepID=A0A7W3YEW3_9GAMM|nr:nucleotide exchange factor GrpE [Lysobacter penaei]MBB1089264.1 nucleotide exchange factor GrpE [Lysobacter penaei]